jgi:hypothetical protein
MENLSLCSKILYDKDYLDAKKELEEENTKPKIIIKSENEYNEKINTFCENIKKHIQNIDSNYSDLSVGFDNRLCC